MAFIKVMVIVLTVAISTSQAAPQFFPLFPFGSGSVGVRKAHRKLLLKH